MKHTLCFLFLLISISINAQSNSVKENTDGDTIFSPKLTGEAFIENKQYIGEQYFITDWVKGDILLSTGDIVYNKSLKYNGLFDEVIWMNTSNFSKYKLDKSFISDFWLKRDQGDTIHFKRVNADETNSNHPTEIFVQVGIEGKVSLYIQRKIRIVSEEYMYHNNKLLYYNNIANRPLYYIKLPSTGLTCMNRIHRRTFLRLFPDQKKKISKLLKDHHLNFKTEYDLIKVIGLLNEEEF